MKLPLTFTLLLPISIVCFVLTKDDATAVFVFIAIAAASFLMEVRLRSGRLSKETIVAFFNTPIKQDDVLGQEVTAADNGPKFSLLAGSLIILGVGILAIMAMAFIFSFTS